MHSSGWRRWFPLAIIFGLTAIVAGWITRRQWQSRFTRSQPPLLNEAAPSPVVSMESSAQMGSSAAPIDIATPTGDSPASVPSTPSSNAATQRTLERAHLLAWSVSTALILNLGSRFLEAGHEVQFANLVTWLNVASLVVLLGGIAALLVIWQKNFIWPRWLWRFSGLGIAALISLVATQVSFRSSDPTVTWYQTVPLWLVAVGMALLVTWSRREGSVAVDSTPRWEVLALLGILALAFLLRAVNLSGLPYVLMGDESKFALQARAFNQGLLFQPFQTAIDGHWGLWFMVLGIFTRLLGETIEVIRLQGAIFGTLSILAAYALTRVLWGRRPALIAAALMATYHFLIHFSRNGMNNIYDALFSMLIFGLFWLGWSRPAETGQPRRWPWLLGALALGLAQYFYIGGRVVPVGLALLGIFWLITDRARVKAQALNIALAIGVFVVTIMPIAYFAPVYFNEYMTRFNQTNIVRNGWLEAAMQQQHAGVLTILGQQLRDTIQVFVAGPEALFYQGQSLLTPAMSVLAGLGLLYLLWRIKEGRAFYLISSLVLILAVGGIFTLSPLGGAHHFVGAGPLIYIAIAVFIDRAWEWAGRRWPAHPHLWSTLAVGLIAVLMFGDAYYYFVTFAESRPSFSSDAEPSMVLGEYLHDLEQRPETYSVICVRAPMFWCSHDNVIFLAPRLGSQAHDLAEPPRDSDLVAPPDRKLIVIVWPNLPDDLATVQAHFPNIMPLQHYGINGNLLFTSFEIPAAPG